MRESGAESAISIVPAAAILAVAASEGTVAKGAGLLAIYSLGLGIPFVLAAFAASTAAP